MNFLDPVDGEQMSRNRILSKRGYDNTIVH